MYPGFIAELRHPDPLCVKEPFRHESAMAVRAVLLEAEQDDVMAFSQLFEVPEHLIRVKHGQYLLMVPVPVLALVLHMEHLRLRCKREVT